MPSNSQENDKFLVCTLEDGTPVFVGGEGIGAKSLEEYIIKKMSQVSEERHNGIDKNLFLSGNGSHRNS